MSSDLRMELDGSSSGAISKAAGAIKGWIESMFLAVSRSFLGQPIFKTIDYCLNVVEKSTLWSLSAHEISAEEDGKIFGRIELLRPLPWILFLPGLIMLRIFRDGINVGAYILGYPRLEPIKMVKYVQKCRRRLRMLHLKASKSSRRRVTSNKDKILIRSIRLTLSTLFCLGSSKLSPSPPPIKICVTGLDFDTTATSGEGSNTESTESPSQTERKRKLSQPVECIPQPSSSSSDDEQEHDISASEVEDIKNDTAEFLGDSRLACHALLLDKTSSDTETETAAGTIETRVDSSETKTQIEVHASADFIMHEALCEAAEIAATVPETEAALPPLPTLSLTEAVASQERNDTLSQERNDTPSQERNDTRSQQPSCSSTLDNAFYPRGKKHKPGKKQSGRHATKHDKRFLEVETTHSDVVP
ncbi:uncharacterized protein LOC117224548 isoform X6 [Megalopta genalis]|uniref:uncharacterized protein LOC117224548 isoform X6 n=1 Tax=Megalopta genalis TaxID=115081 RepID=UPI003FD48683